MLPFSTCQWFSISLCLCFFFFFFFCFYFLDNVSLYIFEGSLLHVFCVCQRISPRTKYIHPQTNIQKWWKKRTYSHYFLLSFAIWTTTVFQYFLKIFRTENFQRLSDGNFQNPTEYYNRLHMDDDGICCWCYITISFYAYTVFPQNPIFFLVFSAKVVGFIVFGACFAQISSMLNMNFNECAD